MDPHQLSSWAPGIFLPNPFPWPSFLCLRLSFAPRANCQWVFSSICLSIHLPMHPSILIGKDGKGMGKEKTTQGIISEKQRGRVFKVLSCK